MAFFRNYSNEVVSHTVLDEKGGRGQILDRVDRSVGNEDVEASSSEKEFEMNMDGYRSYGEANDASRLQDEAGVNEDVDVGRVSNLEPSTRQSSLAGKWGSNFWKDCQPMCPQEGFDSGQELKSADADKNEEGSDYNISEDSDGQKEVGQGQKGQTDVPADEMLSDDYYEQDGEDQSDSLHYKRLNNSSTVSSRPQPRPAAVSNNISRKSKASNYDEYDDDDNDDNDNDDPDADADYEDEDDEDGNVYSIIFNYYFLLLYCEFSMVY